MRSFGNRILRASYRFGHPYVRDRGELPHLFNTLGLGGEGAEIGVQLGVYSATLLEHWRGRRLWSIDPWRTFDSEVYVDMSNQPPEMQEYIYARALAELARFGDRSVILRTTSAEAAPTFADAQLDFVYLDAQHHYEAIREDLELWLPKVRSGGVLAGHDYLDGETEFGRFGVRRAVNEFAQRLGKKVRVTAEPEYPSWWIRL